jgi:hypothetical protein
MPGAFFRGIIHQGGGISGVLLYDCTDSVSKTRGILLEFRVRTSIKRLISLGYQAKGLKGANGLLGRAFGILDQQLELRCDNKPRNLSEGTVSFQ